MQEAYGVANLSGGLQGRVYGKVTACFANNVFDESHALDAVDATRNINIPAGGNAVN